MARITIKKSVVSKSFSFEDPEDDDEFKMLLGKAVEKASLWMEEML